MTFLFTSAIYDAGSDVFNFGIIPSLNSIPWFVFKGPTYLMPGVGGGVGGGVLFVPVSKIFHGGKGHRPSVCRWENPL